MKPQPLTKSLYTFRSCSFSSEMLLNVFSVILLFYFFVSLAQVSLLFHLGEIEIKLISKLLTRVITLMNVDSAAQIIWFCKNMNIFCNSHKPQN